MAHHDRSYKVRASSSSLNRKGEDRFLFKPPTHSTLHIPTPKGMNNTHEEKLANEISNEIRKDIESGAKIKRTSQSRAKNIK